MAFFSARTNGGPAHLFPALSRAKGNLYHALADRSETPRRPDERPDTATARAKNGAEVLEQSAGGGSPPASVPETTVGGEAFRGLVARDAEGEATEAEAAFLRRPETLQRWHDVLVALNKDLQDQFTQRRADAELKQQECLGRGPEGKGEWFAFQAQHDAWRSGAVGFKSKVEKALSECKGLVRQTRSDRASNERNQYRRALRRIRGFLSDEAAVSPGYQPMRRELLHLVDDVLSHSPGYEDRERGAGK